MPHIISKSPSKSRPKAKTASLPQQASTLPLNIQKMVHISHSFGSALPEKMAARSNPVAIGTRGTVGSLIMQEIDYFSQLELGEQSSTNRPSHQLADLPSTGEFSKPKLESVITVPRKKKRGSKRYLPSMCSMVEVAESNQPNSFSGFTYRNLKADLKRSSIY
ncbi:hypothetical protein Pfo_022892 [Paulownia fortunei]|nr:hypothetical protein Pfo_022892 [Paulownia fortunei]